MKKTLFIVTILISCLNLPLTAQQVKIEKSVAFDEPGYGWNKLLQLKNGNTLFFHSTKKEGIDLVIYNKTRKQIATRTLESKLWNIRKMKHSTIAGLYEINGEAVLFVIQLNGSEPTLYRMRINGTTGAIVKEDELGRLPETSIVDAYVAAYGNVDQSNIVVEKDPNSDCYAVIFFNSFAKDRNDRIEVVHYDGNHKVLNDQFYDSPNGQFKYLKYIGAVVDGNKRVYVATYGHNKKSSDISSRVVVSRLNAGDSTFTHKLLDFSEDFKDTKAAMLYNHHTNAIQLLSISYSKTKSHFLSNASEQYYLTLLSYIDPETLSLISVKPMLSEKVNAYGRANIDKDFEYSGLPQQMIINNDNTTTILSEKNVTVTTTHSNSVTSHRIYLGAVGISELSDTAAELRGYAINKQQEAHGNFTEFYLASRVKGYFTYPQGYLDAARNNDQFLSYDYINAPNGRYVIFNDLPRNMEKDEDEENRKTVTDISQTNTICYKLNDPKMEKFYLFGEPDGKKVDNYTCIQSSDYNKEINTYATMLIERDGKDEQARIAWITFP